MGINGKIAPQLTDEDLKDMGIKIVGDRCRMRHLIKSFGRKARQIQRTKVLWSGKEQLWFNQCEGCINTCCGVLPEDPSTYTLTNNHLKIKTVEPLRCGPIRLCCCNDYKINNIDLSYVEDVDVNGVPAPICQRCLCCAGGKEVLNIQTTADGMVFMTLAEGEGTVAAELILNQIEESQQIERD